MERHPDDSARPEQPDEEGYAEGQAQGPDDDRVGDFAEGQKHTDHADKGPGPRYSRGQETEPLTPEEEREGDFAEGQRENPEP